ncbi:MAG: hypothetical protein R2856_21775 [Caldilineaceae bacterium]
MGASAARRARTRAASRAEAALAYSARTVTDSTASPCAFNVSEARRMRSGLGMSFRWPTTRSRGGR